MIMILGYGVLILIFLLYRLWGHDYDVRLRGHDYYIRLWGRNYYVYIKLIMWSRYIKLWGHDCLENFVVNTRNACMCFLITQKCSHFVGCFW